ncbi:MAG: YeeE/YedE family protein [Thermaurantimonas sp.]
MKDVVDFIMNPWPWWFSGTLIAATMFTLIFFGKQFGFSSNLRTICTIAGAGKKVKFFNFDWRSQVWNLMFLTGSILGGFVAKNMLSYQENAAGISPKTVDRLAELNFEPPKGMQPGELMDWSNVLSIKGFLILAVGGFMVGFGARYAGGCTSGHAISGLSNLQLPSFVAVIGFFIGGLIMTHLIFPILFK